MVASNTIPDGFDACGTRVSSPASQAVDGDLATAWRVDGNARNERLTLTLPGPATITRVGLLPGYAKIDPCDGTDRFPQNRVIRTVRWTFDDGSQVLQSFLPMATVQYIDLEVTSRSVVLEILDTGDFTAFDTTAVSELEIIGASDSP